MITAIILWCVFLVALFFLKTEERMTALGAIILIIITIGNALLFFS